MFSKNKLLDIFDHLMFATWSQKRIIKSMLASLCFLLYILLLCVYKLRHYARFSAFSKVYHFQWMHRVNSNTIHINFELKMDFPFWTAFKSHWRNDTRFEMPQKDCGIWNCCGNVGKMLLGSSALYFSRYIYRFETYVIYL